MCQSNTIHIGHSRRGRAAYLVRLVILVLILVKASLLIFATALSARCGTTATVGVVGVGSRTIVHSSVVA